MQKTQKNHLSFTSTKKQQRWKCCSSLY